MKAASIDGPLGLLAACPVFDIEILYHIYAYIMNLFWGQINCILSCLLACHVTRDSKTTFKSKVNLQGAGHILAASRSRIACYFCQMVG